MKKIIISTLLLYSIQIFSLEDKKYVERVFTNIYLTNFWRDPESVSGPGSNLEAARVIRQELPKILKSLNIETILDAPCGDFNWMKTIDLSNYIYLGIDIVQELITKNQTLYGSKNIHFKKLNIIEDKLPYADLIICRDLLGHFPFSEIFKTIKNFKKGKSKYILINTFTDHTRENKDIRLGGWRPLNLQNPPFNFPKPLLIINEKYKKTAHKDRVLALWYLDDLLV